MKKKLLATGGILAGVMLVGSSTTFAQSVPNSPSVRSLSSNSIVIHGSKNRKNQVNLDAKINVLAQKFGLDVNTVKQELQSGKTLKQVLDEHGITMDQIKSLFGNKKFLGKSGKTLGRKFGNIHTASHNNWLIYMPTQLLQAEANVLGMTIDQLKLDFQHGQKQHALIASHNMTGIQFHQKVASELERMIQQGTISGADVPVFTTMIERLRGNDKNNT